MDGLLTALPLALGLLDIPTVPEGPIQYRWGDKDVPVNGSSLRPTVAAPQGYVVTGELLNEPSANVEDRRYVTSRQNPFMRAADRLGPQGYYISLHYKEFAQYQQRLHEAAAQHERQRSVARRKSK